MELSNTSIEPSSLTDKAGITLSWLCLVHCLVLPVIVPIIPALNLFQDERIHLFASITLFGIAGYAFIRGFKVHNDARVLLIGLIGVALLYTGLNLPEDALVLNERNSTVLGSIALIFAHIRNISLCKCKVADSRCAC